MTTNDETDRPPRTDDEITSAVWTWLAAMLPTDQTQVESNMLGLFDAMADWTAQDLLRLVATTAGLTAHFYRALETNHNQQQEGQ